MIEELDLREGRETGFTRFWEWLRSKHMEGWRGYVAYVQNFSRGFLVFLKFLTYF